MNSACPENLKESRKIPKNPKKIPKKSHKIPKNPKISRKIPKIPKTSKIPKNPEKIHINQWINQFYWPIHLNLIHQPQKWNENDQNISKSEKSTRADDKIGRGVVIRPKSPPNPLQILQNPSKSLEILWNSWKLSKQTFQNSKRNE